MKGNFHVRFGEGGGETHWSQDQKVRSAPTLRSGTFLFYVILKIYEEVVTNRKQAGQWKQKSKESFVTSTACGSISTPKMLLSKISFFFDVVNL